MELLHPPGSPRSAAPAAIAGAARRTSARELAAFVVVLLFGLALGLAALLRRPDLTATEAFLFGDQSFNLVVADRLHAGERLYADVAFQYGPLAAHGYALFARIFGNSIASYNSLLLLISLANLALAYLLIRRYAATRVTLVVAMLGLTPFLLVPGSLLGAYAVSPYVPMERTAMLAVCLLWRDPAHRGPALSLWIGAVLGAMQGVRFGTAFFLGAAILLVDLIALRAGGGGMAAVPRWVRSLLLTLVAFLAVQGAWTLYALIALPPEIARDSLWPAYALETYDAWVRPGERWPAWAGWRMLVGQQLTPILGAVAAVMAVALALGSGGRTRQAGAPHRPADPLALLIPALFFALASVALFRQVYHFYQFAWALVLPLAWQAAVRPRLVPALGILMVPCFALNAKLHLVNAPDPGMMPVALPDGSSVWMRAGLAADLAALLGELDGEVRESLFLPLGGGLYHYWGGDAPLRQLWFLPGFVRPYDERELASELTDHRALVAVRDARENPATEGVCEALGRWNPFSAGFCGELDARLGTPVAIGENFVVYPVRR